MRCKRRWETTGPGMQQCGCWHCPTCEGEFAHGWLYIEWENYEEWNKQYEAGLDR